MASTPTPRRKLTPQSRCRASRYSDMGPDNARAMMRGPISTTVTSRPLARATAANSSPMKPPPTTTARLAPAMAAAKVSAWARLLAQEDHLAVEAPVPKREGGLHPGLSGADNHDPAQHAISASSEWEATGRPRLGEEGRPLDVALWRLKQADVFVVDRVGVNPAVGRRNPGGHLARLGHRLHEAVYEGPI